MIKVFDDFLGAARDVDYATYDWDTAAKAILYVTKIPVKLNGVWHRTTQVGDTRYNAIHKDNGDISAVYYPDRNWPIEWEGGTAFYDDALTDCIGYASYKFNRLVIFDAKIYHRAMPVTKECTLPRTSIAMTWLYDTNSIEYYNKYYGRDE